MSLSLLALIGIAALILGYRFYGGFIASRFRLDDSKPTPAQELNDGADYVPTPPFYLLGQHFSAIAAAGPIVGPIAACAVFGWVPCLLWIVLGVIFIGAVHDFSTLVASVRHRGRSIAEIVKVNLGRRGWLAILAFIWIALIYVIIAFADVTAGTFVGRIEELGGQQVGFEKGGAVAAASLLYLVLALGLGLVQRKWNPPLWLVSIIFVPATLGVVWLGTVVSTWLSGVPQLAWAAIIMGYCFVAALLPVWLLLQPRGYLGGFVLYIALGVGVIGIFFGGFDIQQAGFAAWDGPKVDDALFPFLFVTIACGACSGFHGLVCSGTTSKQISKESHCKPVGYGGMLLEGFVALIALSTIMITAKKGPPPEIYSDGIASYLTVIIGKDKFLFAKVFGAMVFSTFVFDTLDVATRLGRYILQELVGATSRTAMIVATAMTAGAPLAILLAAGPGSWRSFWILFGTSNQLLASLSLLAITVWLRATGRPYWFTLMPMLFVMTITLWSLGVQAVSAFSEPLAFNAVTINGIVCVILAGLASFLAFEGIRAAKNTVESLNTRS